MFVSLLFSVLMGPRIHTGTNFTSVFSMVKYRSTYLSYSTLYIPVTFIYRYTMYERYVANQFKFQYIHTVTEYKPQMVRGTYEYSVPHQEIRNQLRNCDQTLIFSVKRFDP